MDETVAERRADIGRERLPVYEGRYDLSMRVIPLILDESGSLSREGEAERPIWGGLLW